MLTRDAKNTCTNLKYWNPPRLFQRKAYGEGPFYVFLCGSYLDIDRFSALHTEELSRRLERKTPPSFHEVVHVDFLLLDSQFVK